MTLDRMPSRQLTPSSRSPHRASARGPLPSKLQRSSSCDKEQLTSTKPNMNAQRVALRLSRRIIPSSCRHFSQFGLPSDVVRPVAGIPMPYITEVTVCLPLLSLRGPWHSCLQLDRLEDGEHVCSPAIRLELGQTLMRHKPTSSPSSSKSDPPPQRQRRGVF